MHLSIHDAGSNHDGGSVLRDHDQQEAGVSGAGRRRLRANLLPAVHHQIPQRPDWTHPLQSHHRHPTVCLHQTCHYHDSLPILFSRSGNLPSLQCELEAVSTSLARVSLPVHFAVCLFETWRIEEEPLMRVELLSHCASVKGSFQSVTLQMMQLRQGLTKNVLVQMGRGRQSGNPHSWL